LPLLFFFADSLSWAIRISTVVAPMIGSWLNPPKRKKRIRVSGGNPLTFSSFSWASLQPFFKQPLWQLKGTQNL